MGVRVVDMCDVEGMQYMMQKSVEINMQFLFRDFKTKQLEFNNHLDLLLKYQEKIPKDSIFYRARTITLETYKDLKVIEDEVGNQIINGFPPEKMMAPPTGMASAGRANKSRESVLYLANKPEVCCAEVRPIFTEMLSVIKFTLKSEISILNFKSIDCTKMEPLEVELFKRVMLAMVEPKKEQTDENYALTQYIAYYLKSKGIDGIQYGTLNTNDRDSFNLVLFDEDKVEANEKADVFRAISKSMKFQNLTDKQSVIDVNNGYEKLELVEVDEIIGKIKKYFG